MASIEQTLSSAVADLTARLFSLEIKPETISFQKTKREFEGDLTLVVFPFVKAARKSPEATAQAIGEALCASCPLVEKFNVVKGFLNLSLKSGHWVEAFEAERQAEFTRPVCPGEAPATDGGHPVVIEYSSPNTNKPLHLGHIRNNLLGWSVAEILKSAGKNVKKVNLVNDRGIHICKSMLAWKLFSEGETPASSGMKGDHLVGKYYVIFSQKLAEQTREIMAAEPGLEKDQAENKTPLMLQAHEMLRLWEAGDKEVVRLWETMNGWVYDGFQQTYDRLGVDFDKTYYESQTYLSGKAIVQKGLEDGVLIRKEDGSVWADLRDEGLDEKLLLRKDGTSVYMTQDLGTATLRNEEWRADRLIYVVGNEQNYHFDVLKRVLKKLGYAWGDKIVHLSYGMVELPEGKMKSREGTVVDADDLMDKMESTARETTEALGKSAQLPAEAAQKLYHTLAMGALKYFLLKVDPVKNMLFNPKESIDFNGNTGPFIQYTHARIRSLGRKFYAAQGVQTPAEETLFAFDPAAVSLSEKESLLIQRLLAYRATVQQAADQFSPAVIANYLFDLAKEFNGFYQDTPILREENEAQKLFRLALAQQTGFILKKGLHLLGIDAPESM